MVVWVCCCHGDQAGELPLKFGFIMHFFVSLVSSLFFVPLRSMFFFACIYKTFVYRFCCTAHSLYVSFSIFSQLCPHPRYHVRQLADIVAQDSVGVEDLCHRGFTVCLPPPAFLKETACFIVYPGVQRHCGKWFYMICLIWERKPDRRSVGALECFDLCDLPFLCSLAL